MKLEIKKILHQSLNLNRKIIINIFWGLFYYVDIIRLLIRYLMLLRMVDEVVELILNH